MNTKAIQSFYLYIEVSALKVFCLEGLYRQLNSLGGRLNKELQPHEDTEDDAINILDNFLSCKSTIGQRIYTVQSFELWNANTWTEWRLLNNFVSHFLKFNKWTATAASGVYNLGIIPSEYIHSLIFWKTL